MVNHNKEIKGINFAESIINGFKSIAKGLGSITLFPTKRYTELNMKDYQNGFERDKKSLAEDWEAILRDWSKVTGRE